MTTKHPTAGGYFLSPEDPNFPRWALAIQVEPDQRVHQLSAALVGNCPDAYCGDTVECGEYLGGANTAAVVAAAVASAEKNAAIHIGRAEAAKNDLIRDNRELGAINDDRAKLPDTPIDGPHGRRVAPTQNRTQLVQTQQVVHQRELAGDEEHNKTAHTPFSGHIAAVVAALVETVFTLRVFNVTLTQLSLLTFVPWLAVTVGLAVFNIKVAEWLGRHRRIAREVERAAIELNTRALAQSRGRAGPIGAHAGSLAGMAPTDAQVRTAKWNRNKALVVWEVPLALLLIGLYWRLTVDTLVLELGVITWVLPAAIAAVLAAIMWVLIVEPNSCGNALGDELRASQTIDAQVVAIDEDLLTRGMQVREHGEQCAEVVAAELLEAEERVTDALEVSHRALQIAASVLGIRDVPSIRSENLVKPTMPHIDRIRNKVRLELATQQELAIQLHIQHLPSLEPLPSPHAPLVAPAEIAPGTEHIDPRGLPAFASSTLITSDRDETCDAPTSPRGRLVLLLVVVGIAVSAALAWFLIGHGAFSAGIVPVTPRPGTWLWL